jgi:CheY-like chemotaxis protein
MITNKEILNARILIVDDQTANVQLLEQLLAGSGYTDVSATTQPQTVSDLHQKNAYDLILLDLHMPTLDGFEVMRALKTKSPHDCLPVIVLTAQPAHKLQALQAGARDFISKPFDLVEVKTRIHNMLEVRLLGKELAECNELLTRSNQTLEAKVLERTAALEASEARFRSLTELASDWYWEQDETGRFTKVSGPVLEMLGIRVAGDDLYGIDADKLPLIDAGWNESQRALLQAKISAQEPFLDFVFHRVGLNATQQYRVSGEPMFDNTCRLIGYRGIGVEIHKSDAGV